jgi:hypothetical protein
MTDAATIEHDPLYVSDKEIVRRLGLPVNSGRAMLRALAADPRFPKPDKMLGDKRYWPAVKLFLDRRNGVTIGVPPNHRGRP